MILYLPLPEDITVGDRVPDGIIVPFTAPEGMMVGATISKGHTEAILSIDNVKVGGAVWYGLVAAFPVPSIVRD